MSGRQDRMRRKEIRKELDGMFAGFEEHLRPKPWWVPARVWQWGQRIFVKVSIK